MRSIFHLLIFLLIEGQAFSQELTPPKELKAFDAPYDSGNVLYLTWKGMPYDSEKVDYIVYISESEEGPFFEIGRFKSNTHFKADKNWPAWAWKRTTEYHYFEISSFIKEGKEIPLENGKTYFLKLLVTDGIKQVKSNVVSAFPKGNLFNLLKLNNLIYMIIFSVIILWFIARAKKRELFLRKIPALEAIEEAIGRSTEMGRPIYFLTGRLGMSSVSTIASTIILGEVAKKVATYGTEIKVPHTDPIVMSVCQEITKQAYISAGRPDAYREDSNFFITEDQFSYTAAVDGLMVREKPAACFYMGYYYAESLLLSEVGASIGAIQIAGTDAEHQLPFFVTTCDYTLIGEELYAASAYLSKNPVLMGTLRGQDVGKGFLMGAVFIGTGLATLGTITGAMQIVSFVLDWFKGF
ncbi:MAG: hypothetical protein QME40_02385 [bacterium]|nr:hypothetical protein [bacterium]